MGRQARRPLRSQALQRRPKQGGCQRGLAHIQQVLGQQVVGRNALLAAGSRRVQPDVELQGRRSVRRVERPECSDENPRMRPRTW
ncbi:MAG: hypothetical protein ACRBN8_40195 [Nannocystales bacterium]